MALRQDLDRWVSAGLIEPGQADAIAAHETKAERPLLLYAVAGLGGLAIAIGIVSIVAANWDIIPGRLKIFVDLLTVAAGGYTVARLERDGPGWAREVSLVVLYGLVLASIALIGQVYQLGGETHEALTIWSFLTAVLMSRARSTFGSLIWVLGLQCTVGAWLIQLGDHGGDLAQGLAFSAAALTPLLGIWISTSRRLRSLRPNVASVLQSLGGAQLVLAGTVGTFFWYDDFHWDGLAGVLIGAAAAIVTVFVLYLRGRREQEPWQIAALYAACIASFFLPVLVSTGDLGLVGALIFIGLWLLVAMGAHAVSSVAVLNIATGVIGIRILIVYFEVFGSLLNTGVGLISGGLLTLALAWLWLRKKKEFAEELEGTR